MKYNELSLPHVLVALSRFLYRAVGVVVVIKGERSKCPSPHNSDTKALSVNSDFALLTSHDHHNGMTELVQRPRIRNE